MVKHSLLFTTLQSLVRHLSIVTTFNRGNVMGLQPLGRMALGLSLGLGGWVMVPQVAQAYEAQVTIAIEHHTGESYSQFLSRAEIVARAAAQRSFDSDILVTDVAITINGQKQGLEAPLLSLNVSRPQWRSHPDTQYWSTYYPTVVTLLALDYAPPPPTPPTTSQEPTLGTGDIQTTLRWATIDDLDLAVTDPSGNTASYQNRSIASGGTLDVDANAGCAEQDSTPVENIFWPPGVSPTGNYVAEVNLFQRCVASDAPISFTLRLLVRGQVKTFNGTVSNDQPTARFPFTVQ
jgi:hypothetical protein